MLDTQIVPATPQALCPFREHCRWRPRSAYVRGTRRTRSPRRLVNPGCPATCRHGYILRPLRCVLRSIHAIRSGSGSACMRDRLASLCCRESDYRAGGDAAWSAASFRSGSHAAPGGVCGPFAVSPTPGGASPASAPDALMATNGCGSQRGEGGACNVPPKGSVGAGCR